MCVGGSFSATGTRAPPATTHEQKSGAYARIDFSTGQFIARYEDRRYTAAQRKRRNWDDSLTYLFDLGDGSVIDGFSGGNATRHINHSCDPNCIA